MKKAIEDEIDLDLGDDDLSFDDFGSIEIEDEPINLDLDGDNTDPDDDLPVLEYVNKKVEKIAKVLSITQKRFAQENSEFWVCVYFKSSDQKKQFLNDTNIIKLGDRYVSGEKLAKHLGKMAKEEGAMLLPKSADKRFSELAQDLPTTEED